MNGETPKDPVEKQIGEVRERLGQIEREVRGDPSLEGETGLAPKLRTTAKKLDELEESYEKKQQEWQLKETRLKAWLMGLAAGLGLTFTATASNFVRQLLEAWLGSGP